jgi:hypothetical protein
MARNEQPATQLPVHPEVRFEHSDINPRRVVWTGVWILLGAWISAGLLYYFYAYLEHNRAESGPAPAERAAGRSTVPPEPRIQGSPRMDLQQMRAFEDSQLNSYRWVDRKNGIVSIPIERAIELTAQRGIPPQRAPASLNLYPPQAGTRQTGFEGKVEPEPR